MCYSGQSALPGHVEVRLPVPAASRAEPRSDFDIDNMDRFAGEQFHGGHSNSAEYADSNRCHCSRNTRPLTTYGTKVSAQNL